MPKELRACECGRTKCKWHHNDDAQRWFRKILPVLPLSTTFSNKSLVLFAFTNCFLQLGTKRSFLHWQFQIVVVIGSIGNVIKLCREFKSKDSSQFVLAFMLAIILVLLMLRKLRVFSCVTISKASKLYHSVHTINNYRILSFYDAYKTRKIVFKFRIETFNRFLPIKVCNLTFYNIYK